MMIFFYKNVFSGCFFGAASGAFLSVGKGEFRSDEERFCVFHLGQHKCLSKREADSQRVSLSMMLDEYQLGNVLHMLGVGEHVDGLYSGHSIFRCKHFKVTCLGGRVAADVDDLSRSHF